MYSVYAWSFGWGLGYVHDMRDGIFIAGQHGFAADCDRGPAVRGLLQDPRAPLLPVLPVVIACKTWRLCVVVDSCASSIKQQVYVVPDSCASSRFILASM